MIKKTLRLRHNYHDKSRLNSNEDNLKPLPICVADEQIAKANNRRV